MTSMTRRNWWAFFLSFFGMALLTAPLAVFFVYKWLAFDEPDRTYSCKGGSTCWSGETVNMMLASVFGAFAIIFAGITIVVISRWRRWRVAQRARLKELVAEL
jgi:ABC-type Fe3+ transport system permease subunit